MTSTEFDDLIRSTQTNRLNAGFRDTRKSALCFEAINSSGTKISIEAERYGKGLSCSVSGPFSDEEELVFPFIADAIDPAVGQSLRETTDLKIYINNMLEIIRKEEKQLTSFRETMREKYHSILKANGVKMY